MRRRTTRAVPPPAAISSQRLSRPLWTCVDQRCLTVPVVQTLVRGGRRDDSPGTPSGQRADQGVANSLGGGGRRAATVPGRRSDSPAGALLLRLLTVVEARNQRSWSPWRRCWAWARQPWVCWRTSGPPGRVRESSALPVPNRVSLTGLCSSASGGRCPGRGGVGRLRPASSSDVLLGVCCFPSLLVLSGVSRNLAVGMCSAVRLRVGRGLLRSAVRTSPVGGGRLAVRGGANAAHGNGIAHRPARDGGVRRRRRRRRGGLVIVVSGRFRRCGRGDRIGGGRSRFAGGVVVREAFGDHQAAGENGGQCSRRPSRADAAPWGRGPRPPPSEAR